MASTRSLGAAWPTTAEFALGPLWMLSINYSSKLNKERSERLCEVGTLNDVVLYDCRQAPERLLGLCLLEKGL